MSDETRHLFLYAKGWYKKENPVTDLRHIIAHIVALKAEDLDNRDIEIMLLATAYDIISTSGNPRGGFIEFVISQEPIYRRCLDLMAKANPDKLGVKFGEPDPDILPLAH